MSTYLAAYVTDTHKAVPECHHSTPLSIASSCFNLTCMCSSDVQCITDHRQYLLATFVSITERHVNVLAGSSMSTDQPIFSIVWDTWLNFRTGVVSGLNYTQIDDQAAVFTFDAQYDGQVVQGTNQADATHFFPQTVTGLLML